MASAVQPCTAPEIAADKPTPEELAALDRVVEGSAYARLSDWLAQQRHNRRLGWAREFFRPVDATDAIEVSVLCAATLGFHFATGTGLVQCAVVVGGLAKIVYRKRSRTQTK